MSVALLALTVVGATSVTFLAVGNAPLPLAAEPRFRRRVMAPRAVALLGSTPLGVVIAGAVSELLGPRGGLAPRGARLPLRPRPRSTGDRRNRQQGPGALP